jgi:hypothetical protein
MASPDRHGAENDDKPLDPSSRAVMDEALTRCRDLLSGAPDC